jgi:hypothetical protein
MTDQFSTNILKVVAITKETAIGSYMYEVSLQCRSTSYSDYTAISAHAGICTVTPLLSERMHVQNTGVTTTLILAGTSYTNCAIKEITAAEVNDSMADVWDYSITFVRDTTT